MAAGMLGRADKALNTTERVRPPTREQLLYWLHEASEIEHHLMCCYLYAALSLKREEPR